MNSKMSIYFVCVCNIADGAQDLFVEKFGVGGVMRQTTNSLTPLHHAARHGFLVHLTFFSSIQIVQLKAPVFYQMMSEDVHFLS